MRGCERRANLDIVDEVELAEVALDVVLDKHRLDHILGRKPVNLIQSGRGKRVSHTGLVWRIYNNTRKTNQDAQVPLRTWPLAMARMSVDLPQPV